MKEGFDIVEQTIWRAHEASPCPFCGSKEIVFERYQHDAGTRWKIWCTGCMATIDPGWAQQPITVLDKWNHRVNGNESEV